MNLEPDDLQPAPDIAPVAVIPGWRLFLWSVRRELWEHRAVYIAPPAIASILLLSFVISTWTLPGALREAAAGVGDPERFMNGYGAVAFAVMTIGYLASLFYCLDALQGERRDRSILFWKSLPVSDTMTVLSKAVIPLVVVPVVILGTIIAFNLVMVLVSTLVVMANGLNPAQLWSRLNVPFLWLALLQGLTFMALWYAPVWAWLLMVSTWAKRMAFLWAFGPVVAAAAFEHILFNHFSDTYRLLEHRMAGGFAEAFSIGGLGRTPISQADHLDPVRLFTSVELWGGVVVAVLFLFVAIRLRRTRAPL